MWLHLRLQVCEALWAMVHSGTLNLESQGLQVLQAAAAVNALACLLWSAGAAHEADLPLAARLGQLALQVFFATVLGAVALVPLALTQNAVMDRLGVPPPEQP